MYRPEISNWLLDFFIFLCGWFGQKCLDLLSEPWWEQRKEAYETWRRLPPDVQWHTASRWFDYGLTAFILIAASVGMSAGLFGLAYVYFHHDAVLVPRFLIKLAEFSVYGGMGILRWPTARRGFCVIYVRRS